MSADRGYHLEVDVHLGGEGWHPWVRALDVWPNKCELEVEPHLGLLARFELLRQRAGAMTATSMAVSNTDDERARHTVEVHAWSPDERGTLYRGPLPTALDLGGDRLRRRLTFYPSPRNAERLVVSAVHAERGAMAVTIQVQHRCDSIDRARRSG